MTQNFIKTEHHNLKIYNNISNPNITTSFLLSFFSDELRKNHRLLLIFDLDDTIFDTSYRRYFIYTTFLRPIFKIPKLNFKVFSKYYNFSTIIKKDPCFQRHRFEIMNLYNRLMLNSFLLWLDRPFDGVSQFFTNPLIQSIPKLFLSGRSESMRKATLQSLKTHGIISSSFNPAHLILKKSELISDEVFKQNQLRQIKKQFSHATIIIFDNESLNCKFFNGVLPSTAIVIRFNSVQRIDCRFKGYHLNYWKNKKKGITLLSQ
ncbi:MAG: hypothetical protein ACTSRS_15750 [Candidatus Helarchaeota archaeon]